jgi:hypothetical protein
MFFRYRDIHFVPVQEFKRFKGVFLWTGSRKRAGGFVDADRDKKGGTPYPLRIGTSGACIG